MPRKFEEDEVKGEVLGNDKRRFSKRGESYHVSIPKPWRRFFDSPLLDLELIRQENVPWYERYVILIKRPNPKEE